MGHETDFTIADFVSDLRAPTPSAAAELAVFDYRIVEQQKEQLKARMTRNLELTLQNYKTRTEHLSVRLRYLNPEQKLHENQKYAIDLEDALQKAMARKIEQNRHRLELLAGNLEGLSPVKKLMSRKMQMI